MLTNNHSIATPALLRLRSQIFEPNSRIAPLSIFTSQTWFLRALNARLEQAGCLFHNNYARGLLQEKLGRSQPEHLAAADWRACFGEEQAYDTCFFNNEGVLRSSPEQSFCPIAQIWLVAHQG